MKEFATLAAVLVLAIPFAGMIFFSPSARADMPIEDVSLYFTSLQDLKDFYKGKKFGVLKYDGNGWSNEAYIDKDTIANTESNIYILAPYDYYDRSGYPHQIAKKGCIISLSNIDDATVVITGFKKATITVRNFHGTLVLGKHVDLQRKVEHHKEWWSYIEDIANPEAGIQEIISYGIALYTTPPAVYWGIENSVITIEDVDMVYLTHVYVFASYQDPIIIRDAGSVVISDLKIAPAKHTTVDGGGLILRNVRNFTIRGKNSINRYHYNLDLREVDKINVNGYLFLNGSYYNRTDFRLNYGVGIYANQLGDVKTHVKHINAVIGSGYYADVIAYAKGNYNESSRLFVGNITDFIILLWADNTNFHSAVDYTVLHLRDKVPISEKVNLSDLPNATLHTRGLRRDYSVYDSINKTYTNATCIYSNFTVLSNTTGSIIEHVGSNNTTYVEHTWMVLYLAGYLLNGSLIDAYLHSGIKFMHLATGVGVPDNGTNEKSLVDYIQNSAGAVEDVDSLVAYHLGYISSESTVNTPLIFGGFSAIVGVIVAVGWMRIGAMMHSINREKREQAKDMIFKASVGTIITAMVLFGWANLMGLMRWIFGG